MGIRGRRFLGWGLVMAACGGMACGGAERDRVPVAGSVHIDGQPLAAGTIRFAPLDGQGRVAIAAVRGGVYSLDRALGPTPGEHRVEIEAAGHWGFDVDDEQAYAERARRGALPVNPIPPRYNRQSTLRATVPPGGDGNLNFHLTVAGK